MQTLETESDTLLSSVIGSINEAEQENEEN